MPVAEFKEKGIKIIQTEFITERAKRRVDMLEKEVEKLTGNKTYQEEEYIPDREYKHTEARRPDNAQTGPIHHRPTLALKGDPHQLVLLVATLMWEPEGEKPLRVPVAVLVQEPAAERRERQKRVHN